MYAASNCHVRRNSLYDFDGIVPGTDLVDLSNRALNRRSDLVSVTMIAAKEGRFVLFGPFVS